MNQKKPIIIWFRRDFRTGGHPALHEASKSGRPIIPVVLLDEVVEAFGSAPKWRFSKAVEEFERSLNRIGSRLILRRGSAAEVLLNLMRDTQASDIWWTRAYDPASIARDSEVKCVLKNAGFGAKSWPGQLLFEPWTVKNKNGTFFKVYSPMWRTVKDVYVSQPEPAPKQLIAPAVWPKSDRIEDWSLGKRLHQGATVLRQYANVGEIAAQSRLLEFINRQIDGYKEDRDYFSKYATSGLSENLAWGEISPREVWHAGSRGLLEGQKGAEHFLKELIWREFAYHLVFHTPEITSQNWRPEWDAFQWSEIEDETVMRWKQGRTGIPLVDAAMREMYVTGKMHNRGRMIVGSFLTKHLLKHWRIGQKWFEECLIDWDPAANALGWQWVAGSGPDAAPYFRVFNPETQAQKFDPEQKYIQKFLAERATKPGPEALAFFEACPLAWGLTRHSIYPAPIVELAKGRKRALAAYEALQNAIMSKPEINFSTVERS